MHKGKRREQEFGQSLPQHHHGHIFRTISFFWSPRLHPHATSCIVRYSGRQKVRTVTDRPDDDEDRNNYVATMLLDASREWTQRLLSMGKER